MKTAESSQHHFNLLLYEFYVVEQIIFPRHANQKHQREKERKIKIILHIFFQN